MPYEMSPEEFAQVLPAESNMFASPIPTQSVSSHEFMPPPQSEKQREFEARVKAYGDELSKHQGLTRRRFFQTASGMAAAFLEIPDDMQKKYGFAPLGEADGPVKTAIFGANNARLYNYTHAQKSALLHDKFAEVKAIYEKEGTRRSNLAYGYIAPRA